MALQYRAGDKVKYIGIDPKFIGSSGVIICTSDNPQILPDIVRGNIQYPIQTDYAVRLHMTGGITFVMNVNEGELEPL